MTEAGSFAPTVVGPIDRRSSRELVALHIRAMIFNGRLRHGDRVRQDELADELGVSRIPVREAIIALAGEGWLTVTPHRGAFVHGLDPDTVRDHYELVGLVYGMAARRAAERATEEGLARLTEAQVALGNAETPAEVHDTNDSYLRCLNELAKAPRLASVMRGMSSVVPGNFFELVPGTIEVQKFGTAAVVRAIRKGAGEKAADECLQLLRRQGECVIELLESRGMFAIDEPEAERAAR